MRTALTLACAGSLLMSAAASATSESRMSTESPFARPSTLAYQLPPFDRIRTADFMPGFEAGMAAQRAEIEAIAQARSAPGFDNTIVALERSGQLLARVSAVFFNLSASDTSEELDRIQEAMAPRLAAHRDTILLDARLFARVEALYNTRRLLELDAESLRLLERTHTQFVRAGARLDEAQKQKLRAINEELSQLTTRFEQNLLKETNASALIVDAAAELAGLSAEEIDAAAQAARARGLDGKFVLSLQNTSGQPPLARLHNRALREKLLKASLARGVRGGEFDNRALIARIVSLRGQRAGLLGYPNHAAYVLEDETARTAAAVNERLAQLAPAAAANARREAAQMQKLIDAENGGFTLAAWDWAYYAEKLRKAQYDFDESEMKPYLPLESVLQNGVFYAAQRLYGLSFKERKDLPVYHPEVRVFEVFNADGAPLGLFLADFFKRDSKRGGAWMNELVSQSALFGSKPVVVNNLNIPKPADGQPVLLTFDEVTTMFHEFGHALHGLFSQVRYPMFAGTNVPRDFVEYPSQVNEMWATDPEVLKHYARHYQSGAPLPKQLVDKFLATQKFNQGFATSEYLAAAIVDQRWHQRPADAPPIDDVPAFEMQALQDAGLDLPAVPPRYRSGYFAHVFACGYDAGYYAYMWSEVLDADTVVWFAEKGGLKRDNGDRFRAGLLSRGGSIDAMTLFRAFRGREPSIAPLLERRGLDLPAPR